MKTTTRLEHKEIRIGPALAEEIIRKGLIASGLAYTVRRIWPYRIQEKGRESIGIRLFIK